MLRLLLRFSTFVLVALGLVTGAARATSPPGNAADIDRLHHRLSSMEKALDHLLLDSSNFLVQRGRNANGVYLPEYGAVFTFNAELNTDDSFVQIYDDDDGGRVTILRHDGWHRHGNRAVWNWLGIRHRSREDRGDRAHGDDAIALYEDGKKELIELLLDHAGTLASLPAGQSVAVSGYVHDETLREEKKVSRVVLRVRIDDLKAYVDHRLSDDEARARILVEES